MNRKKLNLHMIVGGIDTSYDKTEEYISKSATLMVGRNNSGKTTILSLLKYLQNTKCYSTNVFKYTDFNLNYLQQWYDENIYNKNVDDIMNIPYEKLPILELSLEIGSDDKGDVIGKFEDILIVRDVIKEELQDEDIANVNICIKV